jgi:hypothetical protein
MKLFSSTFFLLVLIPVALIVLFIALVAPVPKELPLKNGQIIDTNVVFEEGTSVSDYFNSDDIKRVEVEPVVPSGFQKDEVCIIEGQTVKEGTVASNTTCVSESTPTP